MYDCITAVLSIHEKEVRVCPPNGQDEAQGCILPPQVPSDLQPIGVTNWDNVCCSFIEESLNRTNCVVEEDIYLILGEILEEKDVVLEVMLSKTGSVFNNTKSKVKVYRTN